MSEGKWPQSSSSRTGRDQRHKQHCRTRPVMNSTLSWEGMPLQGLTALIFLFFLWIAFPCPWHQARRNPLWWNLPTGWAVKSTLQPGSPSTAAKNNRDNRWRESWDVEANVPQASFVFSVRGNFFHAIPLVVCWEWLVQCFSSPEFSWLCKLWLTLGIAEVQHLWHREQRLGNSSSWGSAAFEIIGESVLCTH